ncbi:hypothetical protein [Streptomyces sp. NBC_00102]|uniref:hypothetical protein n=1 Tax=Streptomyces sp. NBC_00102 TaxID=2975652 RepID=UPI00224F1773|nr:hypothetical protein [Streptomyces sp. NBC_00102]MCX5398199.1 hypothetical protein [Streptomyces sp. NBC_00102]
MSTPDARSVTRAGAGLRLLRASVFAAVCVVLSAAGHALASASTVPWWALLCGFLVVLAVVAPLAGRERSLPSIAAALAVGQLSLHALFGLAHPMTAAAMGTAGAGTPAAATPGDASLVRFAASLVCGDTPGSISVAQAHRIVTDAGVDPATMTGAHAHLASAAAAASTTGAPAGLLPGLPMVLGHLLAALVTGWLLRRGEVALFGLARLSAHGGRELAAAARLRSLRAALALVRILRAGFPGAPTAGPRQARTSVDAPAPATGDPLQHLVIRRGPPAAYALAA